MIITTDPFVGHILQELAIDHTITLVNEAPFNQAYIQVSLYDTQLVISLNASGICFRQIIIDLNDPNSLTEIKHAITSMQHRLEMTQRPTLPATLSTEP